MVSVSPTTLSASNSVPREAVLRNVCPDRIHKAFIVTAAQTPRTARIFRLAPRSHRIVAISVPADAFGAPTEPAREMGPVMVRVAASEMAAVAAR